MSKRKGISLAGLSLGLLAWSAQGNFKLVQAAARGQSATAQAKVTLREALRYIGQQCDCYFTLEQAYSKEAREMGNNMEEARMPSSLLSGSPNDTFEALTKGVPNLTYQVDPINQKIVHLRDSRLTNRQYALDATLNGFEFVGRPSELVAAIAAKGIDVSPNALFFIGEPAGEYKTVLHLKGSRLTVRDALTEFFPLERRKGRVLWIATTGLGEHQTSYIKFPSAAFDY